MRLDVGPRKRFLSPGARITAKHCEASCRNCNLTRALPLAQAAPARATVPRDATAMWLSRPLTLHFAGGGRADTERKSSGTIIVDHAGTWQNGEMATSNILRYREIFMIKETHHIYIQYSVSLFGSFACVCLCFFSTNSEKNFKHPASLQHL